MDGDTVSAGDTDSAGDTVSDGNMIAPGGSGDEVAGERGDAGQPVEVDALAVDATPPQAGEPRADEIGPWGGCGVVIHETSAGHQFGADQLLAPRLAAWD